MRNRTTHGLAWTLGVVVVAVAGWTGAISPAAAQSGSKAQSSQTPQTREAAAARAEARRGKLGQEQSASEMERNAFARCEVFKAEIDRVACVQRVQQGRTSGSVEAGGILREGVIQVQVPAGQ